MKLYKKSKVKKKIKKKNKLLIPDSSTFEFYEDENKNKSCKYKIMNIIILIIIIFLIINNCILRNKLKTSTYINNIYDLLIQDSDIKLYFKNRSEFFYQNRVNYLKSHNHQYNESNLVTFEDKINYLTIHESPEYKGNIVDKIKLEEYSKKVLGKNIKYMCPNSKNL